MPIDRPNLDDVTEADLIELVANGVGESERIDYKRELYGGTDADKRELLKDVSSFLNRFGGHLVIGIGSEGGGPTLPLGVSCLDPDAEVLRLDSIIRDGLEPEPIGVRVRHVTVADGKSCFVIRIPQSWNLPHRVSFKGTSRFHVRNSAGTHEASMDELRHLFGVGQQALDLARQFSKGRVRVVGANELPRRLEGRGKVIVHLLPVAMIADQRAVSPKVAMAHAGRFAPIGANGGPRFNFEGVIIERHGEHNFGYTQLFRNGVVEATKSNLVIQRPELLNNTPVLPAFDFERHLLSAVVAYIEGMRQLGVVPPIVVSISLVEVSGAHYGTREALRYLLEGPRLFDQDTLSLPECFIQEFGTTDDYRRALRPALDAIWNAMGDADDLYYDEAGVWTGTLRRQLQG